MKSNFEQNFGKIEKNRLNQTHGKLDGLEEGAVPGL